MNKYEQACAKYVLASQAVNRLTGLIGDSIIACREAKAKEAGEDPEYSTIDCCLPEYYGTHRVSEYRYGVEPDLPVLDCEFCIEADRLIQERKKARAALGAAKRQITVLGKKALKQADAMPEARK